MTNLIFNLAAGGSYLVYRGLLSILIIPLLNNYTKTLFYESIIRNVYYNFFKFLIKSLNSVIN